MKLALANQKELNKFYISQKRPIDGVALTDQERIDLGIPNDVTRGEYIPHYVGSCFVCGRIVSDFDWCYGCEQFICGICNVNLDVSGKHDMMEHLVNRATASQLSP